MKRVTTSFWMRASKKDKKGNSPIYFRIQAGDEKTEISTGVKIPEKFWISPKQAISPKYPDYDLTTSQLDNLYNRFKEVYKELLDSRLEFDAETIKSRMGGESKSITTLLELMNDHNHRLKSLVGRDYKYTTLQRYITLDNHLRDFLLNSYNQKDILLSHLSNKFLSDFEHYLKTKVGIIHNTATKYVKNVKKVINYGIINRVLDKNPFLGHQIAFRKTNKEFLTEDEIIKIENKRFEIPRLEKIRQLFLFSCYTSLPYSDLMALRYENILTIKGTKWIIIDRFKNGNPCRIPLMKKAEEIIGEGKSGLVFKNISNQKYNSYLHEIGDLCGINKTITTHLARHAFATIALTKGLSLSTIAAIMGHSTIKTTEKYYAKVTNEKILNEFQVGFE